MSLSILFITASPFLFIRGIALQTGVNLSAFCGGGKTFYPPIIIADNTPFVQVDQKGTEAAASTGVMVYAASILSPPKVFRADHLFLFLIRDNASGAILFMGKVCNPVK